jgi:hypothetical protein
MIKTWSPTAVERSATTQIIFAVSFDHLVGFGEQRRWHVEAERPRSLGVDKQLELASVVRCTRQATYDCTQHGLLHRIGGFFGGDPFDVTVPFFWPLLTLAAYLQWKNASVMSRNALDAFGQ